MYQSHFVDRKAHKAMVQAITDLRTESQWPRLKLGQATLIARLICCLCQQFQIVFEGITDCLSRVSFLPQYA